MLNGRHHLRKNEKLSHAQPVTMIVKLRYVDTAFHEVDNRNINIGLKCSITNDHKTSTNRLLF